jgi:hypothetical protein
LSKVVFDVGVKATGCSVLADNTVQFIGSDNVLYRMADTPQRISDHAWEEHIGASSSHSLFTFEHQGHIFLAVRMDSETLVYDLVTQETCEFQTAQGNWIASCSATKGSTAYFGHAADGKILKFSGDDDAGTSMESRFTFAQALDKATPVYAVHIWANAGHRADHRTAHVRRSGQQLGATGTPRIWGLRVTIATFPSGGHWGASTSPA